MITQGRKTGLPAHAFPISLLAQQGHIPMSALTCATTANRGPQNPGVLPDRLTFMECPRPAIAASCLSSSQRTHGIGGRPFD